MLTLSSPCPGRPAVGAFYNAMGLARQVKNVAIAWVNGNVIHVAVPSGWRDPGPVLPAITRLVDGTPRAYIEGIIGRCSAHDVNHRIDAGKMKGRPCRTAILGLEQIVVVLGVEHLIVNVTQANVDNVGVFRVYENGMNISFRPLSDVHPIPGDASVGGMVQTTVTTISRANPELVDGANSNVRKALARQVAGDVCPALAAVGTIIDLAVTAAGDQNQRVGGIHRHTTKPVFLVKDTPTLATVDALV